MSLVFLIAKETGWSEDTILDLPLGRAWSYRHAILRSYDIACRYKTSKEEKVEMYDLFNTL